jgi:hypothetical protein
MEQSIWIDLGFIGHKSHQLNELFRPFYLIDLPKVQNPDSNDKWVIFINYYLSNEMGTKVLTNAFASPCEFYKLLTEKLLDRYVEINIPLDFGQDF